MPTVVCSTGGADSNQMNQIGPKGGCASNECSQYLTKVGDYVSFFKGLKSDPANVIVAGIMGPTTPYEVELRTPPGGGTAIPAVAHSCSYVGGTGSPEVADSSVRMVEFMTAFPNRNTFSTICQQDLSGSLTQIAQLLRTVIGRPCIEGKLADVDPNTRTAKFEVQEAVRADVLNVIPPQRAGEIAAQAGVVTANNRWCEVDWLSSISPNPCLRWTSQTRCHQKKPT